MEKILTKGNVIVNDIKVGDTHYEFQGNLMVKTKVVTEPKENEKGHWSWTSKNLKTGNTIGYYVNPEYPHYSVNLYDYEAYRGCTQI